MVTPSNRRKRLPFFVYGTLRPGEKNYPRYLQGRTVREEEATVCGELYFVREGGYPYALPGAGTVYGHVVEIAPERYEEVLNDLDALEEYNPADEPGSVYLRRPARVRLIGGGRAVAWIYYWNRPGIKGERIESGDFRQR